MNADTSSSIASDPLAHSLFGEYFRMLLVGTAGCSAVASAVRIGGDADSLMLVIGNILVLSSLVSSRFSAPMRLMALVSFAGALTWMTIQSNAPNGWWSPFVFFSPATLLASLIVLAVREGLIVARDHRGRITYRTLAAAVGIGGLLAYMIVIPSIDAFLDQFRDQPSSYTLEELTAFEQLRVRSVKFAVFAIFAYFGACVASFINVVAASAPRGESIVFRSSGCPRCNTPIRRIDNFPIFSYLNLGGRCRACDSAIPSRYFWVEVVGAAIFGLLFLYELVTGAANVPRAPHYHHAGILWIILYTKWPVVSLYLFHAAMFSALLMLSLMDLDRLRCPRWLAWSMVIAFACLPIGIATLRPVVFDDQIPLAVSQWMPFWLAQAVTSLLGGVTGWLLATLARRYSDQRTLRRATTKSFPLAATLIGVTLGWQATVTVALLCLVCVALFVTFRRLYQPKRYRPKVRIAVTSFLLTVAMIHHPAWKWLAGFW